MGSLHWLGALGGGLVSTGSLLLCARFSCRRKNKEFDLERGQRMSVLGNEYVEPRNRTGTQLDAEVDIEDPQDQKEMQTSVSIAQLSSLIESTFMRRTLIDNKRLKLGKVIGQGTFGLVYKGKLSKKGEETMTVAVKTVNRSSCTDQDVQQFIEETFLMHGLRHKNVLSVLGLCIRDDVPHVILPYMDQGDLKSYIRNKIRKFSLKNLINYGIQVAQGMAYLQENSFVHRDLAARNCLINSDELVKVGDFGLSRDIHTDEYYRVSNMELPLPVRWMAVESIMSQVFTHKSDVWSFGVVLWELMTRGSCPYKGEDHVGVIVKIRNGQILEQPCHVPDEIYKIMKDCWKTEPRDRPDFQDLVERMQAMVYDSEVQRASMV